MGTVHVPDFSGLGEFWGTYNGLKVQLFGYIKHGFESVNWDEELVQERRADEIYSGLLDLWGKFSRGYTGHAHLQKLRGALYEALFFRSLLEPVCLFRQSAWFVLQGRMVPPEAERVDLEIVPVFEVVPRLFEVKGERVAPQVNADFIILYPNPVETGENASPAWFVDVKSNGRFLGNDHELERLAWQFAGAHYYGAHFQVAYTKRGHEYPKDLTEWLVLPVGAQGVDELVRQAREAEAE